MFTRELDDKQSNAFSFSRFLVPYLSGYTGYAIYMDCDMLLRTDIYKVMEEIDPSKAVSVVKHNYTPKSTVKYLGKTQYDYPRKNWSSFVVWNCGHISNRKVTANLVNNAGGAHLHRFKWLADKEIGKLDVKWNWLVGEYDGEPENVCNVHWTVCGPWFTGCANVVTGYKNVPFAGEWFKEKGLMNGKA